MSEAGSRQRLNKALRPLNAVSVETRLEDGIPDVNYVGGWIECKWLRAWPKREGTIVNLPHDLMTHQRAWIRRRARRGGRVHVMIHCGREWLLIDGATAAEIIGEATKSELVEAARETGRYWPNGLKDDEIVEYLRDGA